MARFVPVTATPEQLESLDDEHDGVLAFQGEDMAPFCYVVRRPSAKELADYNGAVKTRGALLANRLFLRAITVYPTGADFDRQADRWPMSCGACLSSDRFAAFSGGVVAQHQK